MKKVLITQSNYVPWKGYFDAINQVDEIIFYDDMQYTRRDWRNRNKIKTPQGEKWISIPVEVSGKYYQKIKDTKVSDSLWMSKHWKTIMFNYRKASHFVEIKDFVEDLYMRATSPFLSEINYHFISGISQWMGIKTKLRSSSDFHLEQDKTDRLVSICQQVQATKYYTGPAAKNYLDESKFHRAGIAVHYLDYSGYPEYQQLYPPFVHSLSILDVLFNTGHNFRTYLKSFNG